MASSIGTISTEGINSEGRETRLTAESPLDTEKDSGPAITIRSTSHDSNFMSLFMSTKIRRIIFSTSNPEASRIYRASNVPTAFSR